MADARLTVAAAVFTLAAGCAAPPMPWPQDPGADRPVRHQEKGDTRHGQQHPAGRGAASHGQQLEPPLPEGTTLDEMLDLAERPAPSWWPAPIDDDRIFSFTLVELLEYRISDTGRDEIGWDAQGWVGSDDHKLWWKTEGDAVFDGPNVGSADLQLLYATPLSAFWYVQAGLQVETAWQPGRTHDRLAAVVGLQGMGPYRFDLEPALFITDDGDVLPQLTASYNVYLTQRLVLQPRMELNASFQDVPEQALGAGLTIGSFDLRLWYEPRRELAPYFGVRYQALFGETGNIAERSGAEDHELFFLAGLRLAF